VIHGIGAWRPCLPQGQNASSELDRARLLTWTAVAAVVALLAALIAR